MLAHTYTAEFIQGLGVKDLLLFTLEDAGAKPSKIALRAPQSS